MVRRVLAAIGVGLVLVSAAGAFGPGRFGLMPTQGPVAVVEGGIVPCSQVRSAHPLYTGGTVRLTALPPGYDPFWNRPLFVVDQTIEPSGVYRFVLDPGWYTITSGSAIAYVHLNSGDDVQANLRQQDCPAG